MYSSQKIKVQNLSRISLNYQIQIPKKYREELYLDPEQGQIKPNETIFLDCSFVPYSKKQYKIKVPLVAKEIIDPNQSIIGYYLPGSGDPEKKLSGREPKVVEYNFEILGAGGDGSLDIQSRSKQDFIDFDIVKVHFNKKEYATLHNHSNPRTLQTPLYSEDSSN